MADTTDHRASTLRLPTGKPKREEDPAIVSIKESIERHAHPTQKAHTAAIHDHIPHIRSLPIVSLPQVVLLSDGALSGDTAATLADEMFEEARVVDLHMPGAKVEHVLHRLQCGLFDALRDFCAATRDSGARTVFVLDIGPRSRDAELDPRDVDRLVCLIHALCAIAPSVRLLVMTHPGHQRTPGGLATKIARQTRQDRERTIFFAGMQSDPRTKDAGLSFLCKPLQAVLEQLILDVPDMGFMAGLDVHSLPGEPGTKPSTTSPAEALTLEHARMRPAQDVYSRIRHDNENYDSQHYIIGYLDRHDGIIEIPFDQWRKETTHEDFVPMHRVRYFRHDKGDIIWDRRSRVDSVFGEQR